MKKKMKRIQAARARAPPYDEVNSNGTRWRPARSRATILVNPSLLLLYGDALFYLPHINAPRVKEFFPPPPPAFFFFEEEEKKNRETIPMLARRGRCRFPPLGGATGDHRLHCVN